MEKYGIFASVLAELNAALQQVRSVWTDQTAQTYDAINENMEVYAQRIWHSGQTAATGEEMVRKNYDEGEFEGILNNLGGRIARL